MLNDIIIAISKKLNLEFGDTYKIHDEPVKQGLTEPCFFIVLLNPAQTQVIGKRYFRTQPFDIHYFPSTADKNTEMNDVADRLNDAMEFITLENGDKLHGTGINHQIVDEVLHFFVSYNIYVHKVEIPSDYMENVAVNNEVIQ
jgi:hypothetical protein